jgi:hypothetical protein
MLEPWARILLELGLWAAVLGCVFHRWLLRLVVWVYDFLHNIAVQLLVALLFVALWTALLVLARAL